MATKNSKAQARRVPHNSLPGWVWLIIGMVLGILLFLAISGLLKKEGDGFARFGPTPNPAARPAVSTSGNIDSIDTELSAAATSAPAGEAPHYDFYYVLTGREVRMSDAELAATARAEEERKARAALTQSDILPAPLPESSATTAPVATAAGSNPATASAPAADVRYLLQAGSFSASDDAEAIKAKIALLGLSARVESADINGKTVYRVRMGPYASAGELSEAKRKLDDGGLPAMAIRTQ